MTINDLLHGEPQSCHVVLVHRDGASADDVEIWITRNDPSLTDPEVVPLPGGDIVLAIRGGKMLETSKALKECLETLSPLMSAPVQELWIGYD